MHRATDTNGQRTKTEMDTIDLSVIIPTFRRENEVVQAVESVLRDSAFRVEVLVADDSPDGSAAPYLEKIKDPRFSYTKREVPTGGKPAIVRNELARSARGRYLYFLDDDDTASPATLLAMIRSLDRSGHGVAIGVVRPFGKEDSSVVQAEIEHYRKAEETFQKLRTRYMLVSQLLFKPSIIVCSACIIRREAFEAIGGFDPSFPLYEDVAMYIRAVRRFGYDFVSDVLLDRRTGEPSLIQNERDASRTHVSYRMIHDNYKREFGLPEYAALKLLSFALPKTVIHA
jgi:GT2 family glycosyltransferase